MIDLLSAAVAISAGISALIGLLVLEHFFRDKIKDLFSDVKYLIFFFLVLGYLLYALGELSYYVSNAFFSVQTTTGIQDIYWTGGAVFILISFMALSIHQSKENGQWSKFLISLVTSIFLIIGIAFIIMNNENTFFGYVYPVMSALIVSFSLSVFLFSSDLGKIALPLQIFFLSSSLILLGDIMFSFSAVQLTYTLTGIVSDLFYLAGYALSGAAFLVLSIRMRALAREK